MKQKIIILAGDPFDLNAAKIKGVDAKVVEKPPVAIPSSCQAVFALEKFSRREWRAQTKDLCLQSGVPFYTVTSASMLKQALRSGGWLKEPEPKAPPVPKEDPNVKRGQLWQTYSKQVKDWFPIACENPVSKNKLIDQMKDVFVPPPFTADASTLVDLAVKKGIIHQYLRGTDMMYGAGPQEVEHDFVKEKAPLVEGLPPGPYGPFKSSIIEVMRKYAEFLKADGDPFSRSYYDMLVRGAQRRGLIFYVEDEKNWYVRSNMMKVKLMKHERRMTPKAPTPRTPIKVRGESLSKTIIKGRGPREEPFPPPVPAKPESLTSVPVQSQDAIAAIGLSIELGLPMQKAVVLMSKIIPEEKKEYLDKGFNTIWNRIAQNWDSFQEWLDTLKAGSEFRPIKRYCKACGEDFFWTAREQKFYQEQAFYPPSRCVKCRKAEREVARY